MKAEEDRLPLEESYLDSTFAGRYSRSAPSFISTPLNNNGTFSLRLFTPTPIRDKTDNAFQVDKALVARLSDVDEVSNENTKSANGSRGTCVDQKSRCTNASTAQDKGDDFNELSAYLPKMEIGSVLTLPNVNYSIQRLVADGPFNGSYALYPLDKSENFVYAKVAEASSKEFLLCERMRRQLWPSRLLRTCENAFSLAVNCYKFLDGQLLTFRGCRNRSLADVLATVELRKIKLHEGVFAYFVLETLKMVRAMELMGISHSGLDLGNLLFCDSGNILEGIRCCRNTDDYKQLPVALLKLSNFWLANDFSMCENPFQVNFVGMARCVYSFICPDNLDLKKKPGNRRIDCRDRLPFSWNRAVWNDYFTSFFCPAQNASATSTIDKFEDEFSAIVKERRLEIIRELHLLSGEV